MAVGDLPLRPRDERDRNLVAWAGEVAHRLRGPLRFGLSGTQPALLTTDGLLLATWAPPASDGFVPVRVGRLWLPSGERLVFPSVTNLWNIDNSGGRFRVFREDASVFPHFGSNRAEALSIENNRRVDMGAGGVQLHGLLGRNLFRDSERSDGAGLRVGTAWGSYGIYAEVGALSIGSQSGWTHVGPPDSGQSISANRFVPTRPGHSGVGATLGCWAQNNEYRGLINHDGSYAIISWMNNGDPHTYVGAQPGGAVTLRPNNNDTHRQVFVNTNGLHINNPLASSVADQVIHRSVGGGGHFYVFTSSRRLKDNIRDINRNLARGLDKLRVRVFDTYTGDLTDPDVEKNRTPAFSPDKPLKEKGVAWDRIGLIAEEAAEVLPDVVRYGEDGQPEGIDESALLSILLLRVQELTREVQALKTELFRLR